MSKPQYYIGLMSGTSADGIDLALVDFSTNKPQLKATSYTPYDDVIRDRITHLYQPGHNELDSAFVVDKALAHLFADAIASLLHDTQLTANDIIAIGNHGQTIRHRPNSEHFEYSFTIQIGCSQTLACLTGIDVVGQFRQKDIALGGQGAPLVPAFHQQLIDNRSIDTFIVNIGGIANVTYLPAQANQSIVGFDTGPGNALLDEWYAIHNSGRFDESGNWGASGQINTKLLNALLADSYFSQRPPKSTGREQFTMSWLSNKIPEEDLQPADIQATLTALTANSIANDIKALSDHGAVYLCGGGMRNLFLQQLLKHSLSAHRVMPITDLNIDSDALESMAFAWLAYAYKKNIFSNMPSVTGARKSTTLGVLFEP